MAESGPCYLGFKTIASLDVIPLALFDRDYRCDEEIDEFIEECSQGELNAKILGRKEIENYFLSSNAIARAINDAGKRGIDDTKVNGYLMMATGQYEPKVRAQLDFCKSEFLILHGSKVHRSTLSEEFNRKFAQDWKSLEYRVSVTPGKEVFSSLNELLSSDGYGSLTPPAVIRHLTRDDVDRAFLDLLNSLDVFAQSPS